MALVAFNLVPVTVAFFGAAVILLLARSLTLREAYDVIDWPILVMLGALIPVSECVAHDRRHRSHRRHGFRMAAAHLPPVGALALHPRRGHGGDAVPQQRRDGAGDGADRGELRRQARLQPRSFLMAVAIGAACDFLTPIGHQCNTLVMGPGGYRFGDYWRLGLPLSLIVLVIGVPLIMAFWPLGQ